MKKLSHEAREDLRKTLIKEIGQKRSEEMTDRDLDHIGLFLLEVFKQGLKRRYNLKAIN